MDIVGAPPVVIADAPQNSTGGAWSGEGVIIFGLGGAGPGLGLMRVGEAGGTPVALTTLAEGESSHVRPTFLPDGRHFLYRALGSGNRGPIYLASLDSADRTPITEADSTNVGYSSGHLLFLRDATLMAQPFDPDRLVLSGDAFPVAQSIRMFGNVSNGVFSASTNGVLAYQTGVAAAGSRLTWLDRTGKPIGSVGDPDTYADVRLSPDGTRVAVSRRGGGAGAAETSDIWMFDVSTGLPTRLTFDLAIELSTAWAPDSREVVFNSARKGLLDLYRKPADGGAEQELFADASNKFPVDWSADGRFLLYVVNAGNPARRGRPASPPAAAPSGVGGGRLSPTEAPGRGSEIQAQRLWVLPMSGDRTPFRATPGGGNEAPGSFSPDGRWIVYGSTETGRSEVYVVPFPLSPGGGRWQISKAGGANPRWSRDGKEIFYLSQEPRLMLNAAQVDARGPAIRVLGIQPLFPVVAAGARSVFAPAPDSKRFLVNMPVTSGSATAEPATVVIDWLASRSTR